jgi:uncharacterized membrane protein
LNAREITLASMFTALVYVTTCFSIPMPPPLGVWHMGNLAAFLGAILCGPSLGVFICGVGAALSDVWSPIWGSGYIHYAPATLIIRGIMGVAVGWLARRQNLPLLYGSVLALVTGHVIKNVGYFTYDYMLFGAASFLDLFTLFPKSVVEIVITYALLVAIRRATNKNYLVEEK